MVSEPSWTWRLRAEAAERWWARWSYALLRWCTDNHSLVNRLISALGLIFGAWYATKYVVESTGTGIPTLVYLVAIVAILMALKGLIAHLTAVFLYEKKLVGGSPTEDRFDRLVPQRAQKVALVGQNLASRLDEKYDMTLHGINTLLSRPSVKEIWLVVQTPLALFSVHPAAARHLNSVTVQSLSRLAEGLGQKAACVKVAFHPAATLSMLVVDWHLERRLAVVTPKVQTLPIIDRRLSVVLSGSEFDTVAPHFDRFLSEAIRGEFPGAASVSLVDAAQTLKAMFDLDVVQQVMSYVENEESRIRGTPKTHKSG